MRDFHFLTPNNTFSIDVYRHTLISSINGHLTGNSIDKATDAFNTAKKYLNDNFLYWGQIFVINTKLTFDQEVVSLMLSGKLDEGAEQRVCAALAILPTLSELTKEQILLSSHLPGGIPLEVFDTLPQAMHWVDDILNEHASKVLHR